MNTITSIAHWPDRLEALVERMGPPLQTVRVLAECGSTQDHARSLGLGAVVVAGRQTAGRGQRGSTWLGAGDSGVALSVALPATKRPESSRDVASAIAVALGVLVPRRLRVKAPNDVMLDGRKLAGVLIEQAGGVAVIGVGINVGHVDWPPALQGIAISLHEAGIDARRIDVLELVLPAITQAWR
jgi:BirA family biotin operon repressor/biotin-[acetyl-CoA-carboxylase] ligase